MAGANNAVNLHTQPAQRFDVNHANETRPDDRGADLGDRSGGAPPPQPVYTLRLAMTAFARARIFWCTPFIHGMSFGRNCFGTLATTV